MSQKKGISDLRIFLQNNPVCTDSRTKNSTLAGLEKCFRGSRYQAKTGEKAQFMPNK